MSLRLFCIFALTVFVNGIEQSKKSDEPKAWLPIAYPHIKNDVSKCSRVAGRQLPLANDFPALVCDPDQLFSSDEALSLEKELREVLEVSTEFECPCSTVNDLSHAGAPSFRRICPPVTKDKTFMVAVAVMRKMSKSHIQEFGREEVPDARLRAARSFAEQLKKKWFKGTTRCGEIFLILYSADDNMLYVSTGQAANQKVPNDKLKNMLINVRAMFPGDPVAGIRHLINRLKSELGGDSARA